MIAIYTDLIFNISYVPTDVADLIQSIQSHTSTSCLARDKTLTQNNIEILVAVHQFQKFMAIEHNYFIE